MSDPDDHGLDELDPADANDPPPRRRNPWVAGIMAFLGVAGFVAASFLLVVVAFFGLLAYSCSHH